MATANIDQIDIITARLQQVQGVLATLEAAGNSGDEFQGLTHRTVMQNLWAAGALVDQALTAANNTGGTNG